MRMFRELQNERSIYVVINMQHEPVTLNLDIFENISTTLELYHTTSNSDLPSG
jgi:hypothetical protein